VDGCPRPFFITIGTIGQCLFLSVNRAAAEVPGASCAWSQVPTIGPFYPARTISWPALAVSTVDKKSSWAAQSALVDSPQQSVGDMSGKTFLLLLSVILCASA